MEHKAVTCKQLKAALNWTINEADDANVDSVKLYRSMRRLEKQYKAAGRRVPDILRRLEDDFEREFHSASQGR